MVAVNKALKDSSEEAPSNENRLNAYEKLLKNSNFSFLNTAWIQKLLTVNKRKREEFSNEDTEENKEQFSIAKNISHFRLEFCTQ